MGMHANQVRKSDIVRMAGYKLTKQLDHVDLVPSKWNKSWPKLARRFQSLGALKGFETGTQGATMKIALELDVIQNMISGRGRKRRFPKALAIGLVVPLLVVASLIPIQKGDTERIALKVATRQTQPCSLEAIGRWLQGVGKSEEIEIRGTSVLGGVTAGTLECKGSRYSYTLGSEEPKRVLKLQKLDS